MRKIIIGCILITVTLFSCTNDNNNVQYKAVLQCLNSSNNFIEDNNKIIYESLIEKLKDPRTHFKASIWQPRANEVRDASNEMIAYVEQLMVELKKKANSGHLNDNNGFDESNTVVPTLLFEKQGKGLELGKKLTEFKMQIIAVLRPEEFKDNPRFKNELIETSETLNMELLRDMIPVKSVDSVAPMEPTCSNYFLNTDVLMALVMLTKIKSDLLLAENKLIDYFNQSAVVNICGYTQFAPLVSQSSSVIRIGDSMEINAGIGAMSDEARPSVTVLGKKIDIGVYGLATCKIKSQNTPGDYSVPVKIEYWKPDGTLSTYERRIRYRVVK